MDQFLPSPRLKILPRGGGKNRPQANSSKVALHLKKKKKLTKGISKSKRIHALCQVSLFSAVDPCISVQLFLGAQAQMRLFRAETSGYMAEVRLMNMY